MSPNASFTIGTVAIESPLVLAPLAGIADSSFRLVCKEQGASLVYTEMVSADGLVRGNERTLELLSFSEAERKIGIQLFGSDPDVMARAAEKAAAFSPDLIDLNFGCPARKVVGRQAGCALLNNLVLLRKIAASVVSAVDIPVTAKIRSGWDARSINADKVAGMLEDCGVKAVTVHARSRADKFKGKADWEIIARTKESVSIPVIGNGDVTDPGDVERMLKETDCDAVMIGRGALGNPWIFSRARHLLATGEPLPPPSVRELLRVALRHLELARASSGRGDTGEDVAAVEMRKHIGWYAKGLPGSKKFKQEVNRARSWDDMRRLLVQFGASISDVECGPCSLTDFAQ
ncbi:MAG: tRNA dihydrouridine synthase DusB [Candidatus Eisenbacteria bacterium]